MPNPIPDPDRLRRIKTFPSLVKYLRDDLDWPIESDDFDELTFDYEPEELGLDAKAAVKIKQIKQLRPLADNQPWGIFFVNFEPKRLPVVALRRILRSLVIKKRQSANRPQQAAWQLHDLLFISSYGEDDHRDITFAHFSEDADHEGGLPTLRVLGWDDEDTVLHLVHAHATLKEKLCWPEDDADLDAWRSNWSSAFTLRHREVINTSKALAVRMAELASAIRKRANRVLSVESDKGPLRKLMSAFKEALIHDLSDDDFADMYAQTITYGLLTARVSRPAGLVADNLTDMVPITNPFLKELMATFLNIGGRRNDGRRGPGIDFDELGVNDVVETLRAANMEAVVRDFGDKNPQEDPVIHFYEDFLKEYDAKKRMKRGVFYTPRPVVSFIVRSVDELLRTEFGLADGLADTTTWGEMVEKHEGLALPTRKVKKPNSPDLVDEPIDASTPFVQILDPATGTGTFLVEVIGLIYKTMTAKWEKEGHLPLTDIPQLWNDYVPEHLLPRLHGYEILMAPYAIAHMKIGLKLFETGYKFDSGERARIYLTNALEPPQDFSDTFEQMAPALAHEAQAVNDVKRHQRFTVVIGNPPYSKASQNLGDQFASLIERFRHFRGQRIREPGAILFERDINNDYIKFLGLDRNTLENAGVGVVGVITSNSYLDGKNFRGVRDALATTMASIRLVNLHGDSRSGAHARQGTFDENVFEIETGVSIFLGTKRATDTPCRCIEYAELIGTYADKCTILLKEGAIVARDAKLDPRRYDSYIPSDSAVLAEYSTYPRLKQCFALSVDGIKTSRDGLVIANTAADLSSKIQRFMEFSGDPNKLEAEFKISVANWDYRHAQKHLRIHFSKTRIHRVAYRPLDFRYIYYDKELVFSHRHDKMIHMVRGPNIGMVCASRLSAKGFDHVLPTDCLVEMKYASHDTNSRLFPFFVYRDSSLKGGRESNANDAVLRRCVGDGNVPWPETAEAVFAILNSTGYRARYRDEIKNDFPGVPLDLDAKVCRALAGLGRTLMEVQLLRRRPPKRVFEFHGHLGNKIIMPRHEDTKLYLATGGYFDDVEQAIFEFHAAGYQVCKSWVSAGNRVGIQRKGHPITAKRVDEFRSVLFAIAETLRIRNEIDRIIAQALKW